MPSPRPHPQYALTPVAALLAWLWPGLGHISLGQRRRGFLIMFGMLFLFFTGLLVGGLDCVDRKHDPLWFMAQSGCGPLALAADWANQTLVQTLPAGWREAPLPGSNTLSLQQIEWQRDQELRRRFLDDDKTLLAALRRIGFGRVAEMGTLFVALAGLMNLVVILDVLYAHPRSAVDDAATGGAS